MFYIKFTFDGLQYKLWSINYEARKKRDGIIELIVDIGKEREEDL